MRKLLSFTAIFFLLTGLTFSLSSYINSKDYFASSDKILGYENYLAQNTCSEPSGGCGENYYWDDSTCSCVYSGSCTEPDEGCGEGKYWDSNHCTCVVEDSCTEPSEGCGEGKYWDYNECQCRSESSGSTCTEPSGGCGEGKYWDSYSCSCKDESSCNPPSSGCGEDKYWDSYSCSCKSACSEPAGGCGEEKYWDYNDCSCRSYSSCSPPSSGCGDSYYWDSYYCSCKPYQGYSGTSSCTPPASGCGGNYYWDSYSCNCKLYPENYTCSEPTGGCGSGWEWHESSCTCRSLYDDKTQYSSYYSAYEYDQNFDRLAYEVSERIKCVRSILTPTEYERLRYLVPQNDAEQDEIHKLGKKVDSCWGEQVAGTSSGVSGKTPVEAESCLIDALGESRYRDIYQGKREPSFEEHLWFESCFGSVERDVITFSTTNQVLPGTVDICLRTVLKNDLYEEVKSGSREVPFELRSKVDRCFGADPHPFKRTQSLKIPDSVKQCLLNAVGEERFNQINSGRAEPSDDEGLKGDACFSQLNSDQLKFLPPPPERVPYLHSNPELIGLNSVTQEKKTVRGKEVSGRIVFSGKGPPNSVVNIYIYSEPIVVSSKTDENGDWVYELNDPIEGGDHVAYAVARTEGGDIRSSVYDFTVLAADEDTQRILLEESKASVIPSRFLRGSLIIIFIGAVLLISGVSYGYYRLAKARREISEGESLGPLGDNGEGEGKDTSSSVN